MSSRMGRFAAAHDPSLNTHRAFWSERSLVIYMLIAFGVPWLGWTTLAVFRVPRDTPLGWTLFLSGDAPILGAFVATYMAGGRGAARDLLARCLRWRESVGWWLYALLLPVGLSFVALFVASAGHGGLGVARPAALAAALSPAVLFEFIPGPLGEEPGWRGFLLPRLLERYSPIESSVIIGFLWTLWHLPLYYAGIFASAPRAGGFLISVLCYSVLMTVMFLHTRGNVLLQIVLHWSINIAPGVVEGVFPSLPAEVRQSAERIQLAGFVVLALAAALVLRRMRGAVPRVVALPERRR